MIRINLLPHKTVRKKKTPGMGALVAILLCACAAAVANWMYYSEKQDFIKKQKRTIAAQNTEINNLKSAIGEVESFQAKKKKIEEQLKTLSDLEKGRSGPVKMLDALATSVPKNVWFTSLNSEAEGRISLKAEAVSNEDVSAFMKMLKASVWTPVGIGRLLPDQTENAPVRIELLPSGERREFDSASISHFFDNITLGNTSSASGGTVSFSISFTVNNIG